MSNRKCCAKCKTPYNCGNPGCACHAITGPAREAWAKAAEENRNIEARYHMDHYRGHRDPDGVDGGLGRREKNYGA